MHKPGAKNFYPHYYVEGDTSDVTKRYLRESVTQMLLEYPTSTGIGVSHGEGMAGMTPLQRQQLWTGPTRRGRAGGQQDPAGEADPPCPSPQASLDPASTSVGA